MVFGELRSRENMIHWISAETPESEKRRDNWQQFLQENPCVTNSIGKIDLSSEIPIITDQEGRTFSIDFISDKKNYQKKKGSLKTELISKAMGSGKYGFNILDLSAGLGIDALFLSQLGYDVTAVERNSLIYLALKTAEEQLAVQGQQKVHFFHDSALNFLSRADENFDVIYFDPMFPQKKKSALPRQEMILFKDLVGTDGDADQVIDYVLQSKKAKRFVLKRPLKAPPLKQKPQFSFLGKLIRFDIYGVTK